MGGDASGVPGEVIQVGGHRWGSVGLQHCHGEDLRINWGWRGARGCHSGGWLWSGLLKHRDSGGAGRVRGGVGERGPWGCRAPPSPLLCTPLPQATMLFAELTYTLATEEAERIGVDHVARMTATGSGENSTGWGHGWGWGGHGLGARRARWDGDGSQGRGAVQGSGGLGTWGTWGREHRDRRTQLLGCLEGLEQPRAGGCRDMGQGGHVSLTPPQWLSTSSPSTVPSRCCTAGSS